MFHLPQYPSYSPLCLFYMTSVNFYDRNWHLLVDLLSRRRVSSRKLGYVHGGRNDMHDCLIPFYTRLFIPWVRFDSSWLTSRQVYSRANVSGSCTLLIRCAQLQAFPPAQQPHESSILSVCPESGFLLSSFLAFFPFCPRCGVGASAVFADPSQTTL
jgi:hypothetical protein